MNLARRKSGQILILVLLIVVVALAVGLSVASRNITNLRSSAQTEQSQRAFTAAEGGVEDVLSRLPSLAPAVGSPPTTTAVPVGDLTANVTVATSNVYQSTIPVGSVGQIDLTGAAAGTQIQIDWGVGGETPAASLGVTQYGYSSTTVLPCGKTPPDLGCRTAWHDPTGSNAANEVGFSSPNCSTPSNGFSKCIIISVLNGSSILRVRPFWTTATVKVYAIGGASLPVQKYDISSTAQTTAGITRKVQVSRTALPQLPTVFDYVLFSNGDISK